MFRFRAAKIGLLVAILVLFTGCAPGAWPFADNQELRVAMAKAGQNCGPLHTDPDYWPNFDCTSAANDGYVVVYEHHGQLAAALREYCQDSNADLDENDWVTSRGYFVRAGSAIIKTLRKHVDFEFYPAVSFCYEL
jgi:hypothetical protein